MKKILLSLIVATFLLSAGIASASVINTSWFLDTVKNFVYPYPNTGTTVLIGRSATTTNSALEVNGTTTASIFIATSTTATSTFANGLNITKGCFAISGTCLSTGGSGSQTPWTSDIDGGGHNLSNVAGITATSFTGSGSGLNSIPLSAQNNDAGFITNISGQSLSTANNDAGFLTSISGQSLASANNDAGFFNSVAGVSGDVLTNNGSGGIGVAAINDSGSLITVSRALKATTGLTLQSGSGVAVTANALTQGEITAEGKLSLLGNYADQVQEVIKGNSAQTNDLTQWKSGAGAGTTVMAKMDKAGLMTAGTFTASSTTASSTFANGLNLTKGCFAISGTCLSTGGAVSSVSAANSSLTITPTTGATTAKINLANTNIWTAEQDFTGNSANVTLGGASYDLDAGHSHFSKNNQIIELAEGAGIAAGEFTDLTNNVSAYFALPTMAASFSAYGGGVNIGTSAYAIDSFGTTRSNRVRIDDRAGFGDTADIYTDFAYAAGEIYFKPGGSTVAMMMSPNGGVLIGGFQSQQVPAQGLIVVGNTGIGTQAPTARLSVVSGASTGNAFDISTSTSKKLFGIDNVGHSFSSGYSPAVSSCGTGSPTVLGDDQGGTITTGTSASSCVLTFAKAYTGNGLYCTATADSATGIAYISATSTTAVTFGISSALTGGHIYYSCAYHN